MRLTRMERAVRLVHSSGAAATAQGAELTLIRLIVKAREWWARMIEGDLDPSTLAAQEGVRSHASAGPHRRNPRPAARAYGAAAEPERVAQARPVDTHAGRNRSTATSPRSIAARTPRSPHGRPEAVAGAALDTDACPAAHSRPEGADGTDGATLGVVVLTPGVGVVTVTPSAARWRS